MRTSVRRYPARYPFLTPAPRAATVSPCGGSSSMLRFSINTAGRRSFKYQKEVKYPTQKLPVRTVAHLFSYFRVWLTRRGRVLTSNTLTSGVHSTLCILLAVCLMRSSIIQLKFIHRLWRGCARAPPSQPVSVNFPFTHAFRGGWCWGRRGQDAHCSQLCGGWVRWALRYMVRFSLRCRQATRRTCSHVLLGKVRDYLQSRIPIVFFVFS